MEIEQETAEYLFLIHGRDGRDLSPCPTVHKKSLRTRKGNRSVCTPSGLDGIRTFALLAVGSIALAGVGLTALSVGSAASAQEPRVPPAAISDEFPFESQFVDVLGSPMHYIDEGEGDPILFLHGNPTSSYLWRNVIPFVLPHGRIIAVDNVGFGRSGKPDIAYTLDDHVKYVEAFISGLELRNVTLVLHDWGSAIGFEYARRNPSNIKAIAFMEALVPPAAPVPSFDLVPAGVRELFRAFQDPTQGRELIFEQNFTIEQMLPGSVVRTLSPSEMDAYREPFLDPESRKPLLAWMIQAPIGDMSERATEIITEYGMWLSETDLPKLLIYVSPGLIIPPEVAEVLTQTMKNIETVYVGRGLHFIQEDHPEAVGRALADWYRRLPPV